MSQVLDNFRNMINLDEIARELEKIEVENKKKLKKEFKEVPLGRYEVKIVDMRIGTTKDGTRPMFKVIFKIVSGEYERQRIFMNQLLTSGIGFKNVNDFLKSLQTGHHIELVNSEQYENLILEIYNSLNCEFALEYGKKDGWNTFRIIDVFPIAV